MNSFFIVTNDGKDKDHIVTNRLKNILENAGKSYIICEKDENNRIVQDKIPEDIDCAIVIGGDGSFIEVARALHQSDIPILGINMGTLGYLTEVEVSHLEEEMKKVLESDYDLENRMMLTGIFSDGSKDVSLNDIVVSRKGALRVIHFDIYVNGVLLNSYEADGVIISTPTGSTAYNLSAGGPIVEPTASLIVITPICSHVLNTSSVVLSGEDEVMLKVGNGRNGMLEEVFVAFDGTDPVTLVTGDTVTIRRSEATTKIMKLSKVSFLEILRRKMRGK